MSLEELAEKSSVKDLELFLTIYYNWSCCSKRWKTHHVLYFLGREDVTDESNLEFHSLGVGKVDRNIDPYN